MLSQKVEVRVKRLNHGAGLALQIGDQPGLRSHQTIGQVGRQVGRQREAGGGRICVSPRRGGGAWDSVLHRLWLRRESANRVATDERIMPHQLTP